MVDFLGRERSLIKLHFIKLPGKVTTDAQRVFNGSQGPNWAITVRRHFHTIDIEAQLMALVQATKGRGQMGPAIGVGQRGKGDRQDLIFDLPLAVAHF